jgi:hypothetical protein
MERFCRPCHREHVAASVWLYMIHNGMDPNDFNIICLCYSNSYYSVLIHLLPGLPGRLILLHVSPEPIECQAEDSCLLGYCLKAAGK